MLTRLIFLSATGLLLMACSQVVATPTPDLVATEVAVKKTAAVILTAEAESSIAAVTPTDTPTTIPPTDTPLPPDTPTTILPTDTPLPPDTPTAIPPTDTPLPTDTPTAIPPTDTPLPPPTATVTPLPPPPERKSVPPDGGDRLEEFFGEIILPDSAEIKQEGDNKQVILHRDIVFRVKVRDPEYGSFDGAGVQEVQFNVFDASGSVYQRTERHSGYCVFGGGEPDCNIRRFDEGWGNGKPMVENTEYTAEMRIILARGDELNWRWRFFVAQN